MVRRAIAAGVGLLVLILLVLGVRGCLNSRKDQAVKDYVGDVGALVQESDQQGRALFQLLSGSRGGREQAVDIENQLNQYRVQSAMLVDRARDTDHPGEVDTPQRYLLETLEFRRDGLAEIADGVPQALGDRGRRQGTDKVTADMQRFLTSDVIYSQRFVPNMQGVLDDRDLRGEVRIPRSQFLPDIQWLQPSFVGQRVSRIRTGRRGGPATPGLHGTGLGAVSLGGQALSPGSPASVQLAGNLSFDVQVMNQGENTETDLEVRVAVGRGGDAIELTGTLDSIAAGETKTVKVAMDQQPPTGQNVPIMVEVPSVPGEKKTDNNKQTYSAIFTK
ncbi:MAG TPA: hypothetical protein VKB17_06535 [Thermoleophilaceae bacterium]|nr:hypothetical protein [Thermoleophilaceae bacterium]